MYVNVWQVSDQFGWDSAEAMGPPPFLRSLGRGGRRGQMSPCGARNEIVMRLPPPRLRSAGGVSVSLCVVSVVLWCATAG